jgi:flagellar motor switch protein FliM
MVLALPVAPQPAAAPPPVPAAPPDPAWIAARARILDDLPLPLEAVLLRTTRPLAEVERLAVGDLIPFAPAALAEVRLEPAGGRALLSGRLGQAGGRRALRLPGPAAMPAPPAAEAAG